MNEIELDTDYIFQKAMQTPAVQSRLMKRATRVASVARKQLVRAKIDSSVTVKAHALETGRASMDVSVTVRDEEKRRRAYRILRAAKRS